MTDSDTAPPGVATIETEAEAEALADLADAAAAEADADSSAADRADAEARAADRTIHDERAITAAQADQSALDEPEPEPAREPFARSKGSGSGGPRGRGPGIHPRAITVTPAMAAAGGKHHVAGFRAWSPLAAAIQQRLNLQVTIGRPHGGLGPWACWQGSQRYCDLPEEAADWLDHRVSHPHAREPLEFVLPERAGAQ